MSKILVIEDDLMIRENLVEILSVEGFETLDADNGIDGILLAREQKPDLIICDVRMQGLDGFEVLKVLKQDENTRKIPFIFLTAKVDRASQYRSMELSADAYLIKPFGSTELVEQIITLLENK